MRALTVNLILLALLLGCNKNASETSASSITAPPAQPAPQPIPATHPPIHPDVAPAPAAAGELGPAKAGGLAWSDPPGLVRHAPKNSMRAAEYVAEGDDQAQLAVFYFGEGQGGAVEPNITRWLAQFTQPDGRDTAAVAKRSELTVGGGVHVSRVEVTGSYGGGMGMPGAPAPTPISDAMLLGAIATGPKGAVFFKFSGPRASVTRARPAFDALVQSIHAE